jgi:tetratricopeptide (TPR) repeat protein
MQSTAADPAQLKSAVIVDLLHDLDFEHALAAVELLEKEYPDSPVAPFYRGVAYMQHYILEDPPSRETFDKFEATSKVALLRSEKLGHAMPAISEYYQGTVYGFQAGAKAAAGRYAAAILDARHGATHLKRAVKMDPSLTDTNLGMGLYYYCLSCLPSSAKPFTYLMVGMRGDRELGLKLLTEVAEHGDAAQLEAKDDLLAIYSSQQEQNWDKAIPLIKELMAHCPHNPLYRANLAYVYQRQGLWNQATEVVDSEGAWIQGLDPLIKDRAQALARYRTVEDFLFTGQFSEAGAALERLESAQIPGQIKEWVALRRGNYWDALGKPEKAKPYYAGLRTKKPRRLAKIFLQTPFPAGPRDVMTNWWPLNNHSNN